MELITSSYKNKSFIYDFAVDGGVIGSFGTKMFIPPAAAIIASNVNVLTTITDGGGGASLNLGWIALATALNPFIGIGLLPQGPGMIYTPGGAQPVQGQEILFSIANAPLTGGSFIFTFYYQEY